MPEEEFETPEFKEKLEEATERAVEASERRSRWVVYLSFSTAVIAVLAAIGRFFDFVCNEIAKSRLSCLRRQEFRLPEDIQEEFKR